MVAIAALLLILFVFRPGVNALRSRISGSIGRALGRRVELDNVRLRFFPRPGFDLEGLVIYDDPAFSAEPMIRAQDVSAAIRLRSLLRGRLEIATLSASEPSINLVRSGEGRWNLASLIERNAQIPAAPTAKAAYERRPAFPYLEATGARINFKIGQTKKSYALMDADVALWQDSENSWGARLKSAPVRTDFNLTDTGLVEINATWHRAPSARATPLQMAVRWQKGQLGQITKLLSGKDRGWRGGVTFTANLSGTPEALKIDSQTAIEGFHRYDIVGNENLRLAARCSGQYDWVTATFTGLACESPVATGRLRLSGDFALASQGPSSDPSHLSNYFSNYDLTLVADSVPLMSAVRLLRQAKKKIPSDLAASGLMNAEFHATRSASATGKRGSGESRLSSLPATQWTGNGSANDVRLSSKDATGVDEIPLGTIPLELVASDSKERRGARLNSSKSKEKDQGFEEPAQTYLRIGPIPLAMKGTAPVNAGGWLSTDGYWFMLRGDAEVKDLYRLESVLGLPLARPAAEGSAKLDVSVSGSWQGFASPSVLGNAQLHNVRAEMHGVHTPIEIASANVILTRDSVLVQKILARTGTTHWSGEVTAPRHCGVPSSGQNSTPPSGSNIVVTSEITPNCPYQFDLTADELSTKDLSDWFKSHPDKRPWYRILSSDESTGPSPLLAIEAQGHLHVGRFALQKAVVTQVSSQVEVQRGTITLGALRGQLLQGKYQGRWTIDARHRPTEYRGSGTLQGISLSQVGVLMGTLMNDGWITGTADGNFELNGTGETLNDLLTRSDGKLQFAMRDGSLPHLQLPGTTGPMPVRRFTGELNLNQGTWALSAGNLESRGTVFHIKGNASAEKGVDFVLTRSDESSWNLTGTLSKLHATAANRTQTDAQVTKP